MNTKTRKIEPKIDIRDRTADVAHVQSPDIKTLPVKWIFVFFDLPSKEFTRRVGLHRSFRKTGLAMHSQSVYCMPYSRKNYSLVNDIDDSLTVVRCELEKVKAENFSLMYQDFIESLFLEIENKIEELEDARADSDNTRGYTKRYKKMGERIENLRRIIRLVSTDSYEQRISTLEALVEDIHQRSQGVAVS